MADAFADLARRLPRTGGMLFGEAPSLADLFWAVELIRAEDVGRGAWIRGDARLSAYHDALLALPAIRRAILDWPGARFDFQ